MVPKTQRSRGTEAMVKDVRGRKSSSYKGCVEKKGKEDSSPGGMRPLYTQVLRPAGRFTSPAAERRRTSQILLHAPNPSPYP